MTHASFRGLSLGRSRFPASYLVSGRFYSAGFSGRLPGGGRWATDNSLSPLRVGFICEFRTIRDSPVIVNRVLFFFNPVFRTNRQFAALAALTYRLERASSSTFIADRRAGVPHRGRDILPAAAGLSTALHPHSQNFGTLPSERFTGRKTALPPPKMRIFTLPQLCYCRFQRSRRRPVATCSASPLRAPR
jgi:hypothetical protein